MLGDSICRRFYSFASTPHRLAAAFLSGLLISSWWTYLCAWLFSGSSSPMLWGNLVYFVTAAFAIYWLRRQPKADVGDGFDRTATEFKKWDWIWLGIFLVFACWLMFSTFNMSDGKLEIAHHQWSDFGSTLSIMQTFANGHNFPTEYPHFSGDRIRYHFLFYFQAGNLEYLGLNPAWSNNLLSIFSLMSMLILVMTLGAVLFGSRIVGRIAAVLFFFHGSLSFIPYLYSQGSISAALSSIWRMRDFLPSGFAYRGELWGVWSQVVYVNQRHLASSIGIFLVVLVFLIMRYRSVPVRVRAVKPVDLGELETAEDEAEGPADGGTSASDESVEESEAAAGEPPTGLAGDEAAESVPDEPLPESDPAEGETPAGSAADEQPVPEAEGPIENSEAAESDNAVDRQELSAPAAPASVETDDGETGDAGDEAGADEQPDTDETLETDADAEGNAEPQEPKKPWYEGALTDIEPFVFSGVLLGLLPLWNGAVFTAAFGVLAVLFVLFPLRRQMVVLGLSTAVIALPQIYYLKSGMRDAGFSVVNWGYTLGSPSILDVLYYLGFIFGLKWPVIIIALIVGTFFQLRVMIAISSLIAITFLFQFSPEALTNHKFLNIWLVIANVFAAAGVWYLWNLRFWKTVILGRVAAGILMTAIVVSGVIDLFPIRNSTWMVMGYQDDPLVRWVTENTDPKSIFLSHRFVNHGILLAGRRLFYGHPYYAWGAGYPTYERDEVYRKMFELRNPAEVLRLLKENKISYVAFDDVVRKGDFIKKPNEDIYQAYFKDVFPNPEERYDHLKIYLVPDVLGEPNPAIVLQQDAPPVTVPAAGAFTGGEGNAGGQFSKPRRIAADAKGNFYVADTGNSRVQKFDPGGKFLLAFGTSASGEGGLKEPNGIATDTAGNIYVTEVSGHKLVKFSPTGEFIKEWTGPEPAFYGPGDIAVGPNKLFYILDQGRTRIVKFDPATEIFTSWGTRGGDPGQFLESTGIGVGNSLVFVADNGNNRIQVFDLDGNFVRQWEVTGWERYVWNYPDVAFDEKTKQLYVTNPWKKQLLAFDADGNPLDPGIKPDDAEKFDNPTSLCITEANKQRRLLVLNSGGLRVTSIELKNQK